MKKNCTQTTLNFKIVFEVFPEGVGGVRAIVLN